MGRALTTAVMVDGGFYLTRAHRLFGEKSAEDRAIELCEYCHRHISYGGNRHLHRIFYYDCPPSSGTLFNPITRSEVRLAKTPLYSWKTEFLKQLESKRKLALRMGELLATQTGYTLKNQALKDLMNKRKALSDLRTQDLLMPIVQKGVDMKMGMDVASLAYGKMVDQIIMVTGDSDFVPAAKLARRHGIDFLIDPMWHTISPSLNKHVDGIETVCARPGDSGESHILAPGQAEEGDPYGKGL